MEGLAHASNCRYRSPFSGPQDIETLSAAAMNALAYGSMKAAIHGNYPPDPTLDPTTQIGGEVQRLQQEMLGRFSIFRFRRRAAHAACLDLIAIREIEIARQDCAISAEHARALRQRAIIKLGERKRKRKRKRYFRDPDPPMTHIIL